MSFNPRFHYTESIVRDFGLIEAARAVVDVLPLPPDRVLRMRQAARERSTRSSTRIEGNTLEEAEIGRVILAPEKALNVMQQEVRNYWRALATTELWRSGYEMRGFLSIEEYYTADLQAYYSSLQMGLPVDYYEGRHDPDHTRWLEYFFTTMAKAADGLREQAETLYAPQVRENPPWERLRRVQQQILTRLVMRGDQKKSDATVFTPGDVGDWFGVSANTARDWLEKWMGEGFVFPEKAGVQRIRNYVLAPGWAEILKSALNNAPVKTT